MTASARGSSSSAPGAPVTSGRCRSTPTRTPRARGAGAGAPVSTAWASPQSATVRAIGPTVSKLGASGKTPSTETAPSAGLRPTTPQAPAGSRTEPPVSVPSARGTSPAASAAALPPLEPPAMRSGCRGLTTSRSAGSGPPRPGELVGVGLADDDRALGLQRRDGRRGATRDVVGEDPRRVGRPHARGVDEVLDEQRHARQAPGHPGTRPGQGRLGAERDHRAEAGGGLEPGQRRRDGLLGTERARPDRCGDLGGGHAPSRATASTSSRAPGTTSRETSTSVLAGRASPKKACRAGLIRGRSSMADRRRPSP